MLLVNPISIWLTLFIDCGYLMALNGESGNWSVKTQKEHKDIPQISKPYSCKAKLVTYWYNTAIFTDFITFQTHISVFLVLVRSLENHSHFYNSEGRTKNYQPAILIPINNICDNFQLLATLMSPNIPNIKNLSMKT